MNSMSAICACCCCCCQCVLHNIMLLLGYLDFGLHLGQIMFSIAKLETGFTLACHYVNLCLSLAKRNRSIIFKCIHPCIQLLSSFKQQQKCAKQTRFYRIKAELAALCAYNGFRCSVCWQSGNTAHAKLAALAMALCDFDRHFLFSYCAVLCRQLSIFVSVCILVSVSFLVFVVSFLLRA